MHNFQPALLPETLSLGAKVALYASLNECALLQEVFVGVWVLWVKGLASLGKDLLLEEFKFFDLSN